MAANVEAPLMAKTENERVQRGGAKPFKPDAARRCKRNMRMWKRSVKPKAPGTAQSIGERFCARDMLSTQDAADARRERAARAKRGSGRPVMARNDANTRRVY